MAFFAFSYHLSYWSYTFFRSILFCKGATLTNDFSVTIPADPRGEKKFVLILGGAKT